MQESERKILVTDDGSPTFAIPERNIIYRSRFGAVQESLHVFIGAGLQYLFSLPHPQPVCIFEMGFGTGLNAILTLLEAEKQSQAVHYTAIEPYPLSQQEVSSLRYDDLNGRDQELFQRLHQSAFDEEIVITPHFTWYKQQRDLHAFATAQKFHLVYFDAFDPVSQPDLWTEDIFRKMYEVVMPGGVLVTYCAKGDVRRAMTAVGFKVEKLKGSVGKREMIRATR